jgi:hypothetical protein
MTENHKRVGIFQGTQYTNFINLLSHCSSLSKWLRCQVLYISGDKTSQNTFITLLFNIMQYVAINVEKY